MTESETILEAPTERRAARFGDWVELTKPRLTLLSVLTTLAGYVVAARGTIDVGVLIQTLIGAFLVGGGCGALNMYLERDLDARMRRTMTRPIPSGRVAPAEVMIFGMLLSIGGIVYLALAANPLTAALAAATLASYLLLYTPMKRLTSLNTVIGGIPGALPPLMGWAAARNDLGGGAWVIFAILFLWQMPHFLALAWMYRRDYERAGYRMLTVVDPTGATTARQILIYSAVLVPVSLMPTLFGIAGGIYFFAALLLGAAFVYLGIVLARRRRNRDARILFFYSLLYLPILLLILAIDG